MSDRYDVYGYLTSGRDSTAEDCRPSRFAERMAEEQKVADMDREAKAETEKETT